MQPIFPSDISLDSINERSKDTLVHHLGMLITKVADNYVLATMPVDSRTHQPLGLLHGGATAALVETVGSFASYLVLHNEPTKTAVGMSIYVNHLKSVTTGIVTAMALPEHIGRSTHVWNIEVRKEDTTLVAVGRLTTAVVEKK